MSYLEFDKKQMINLEYSLSKEYLKSNRAGSYASSTIVNCHTRKYHGLLVCPIDNFGGEKHVLISSLDETIIQHDKEFHLAVRKYPSGIFHPGHKYVREFSIEPVPTLVYRVGGVILKRELLIVEKEERILIRYTLLEANSPTKMRFHPFLCFRHIHECGKANLNVSTKFEKIDKGVKLRMYNEYPYLHMQLSKKTNYISAPDWFYNAEYPEEEKRGYDFSEDFFVPGFFEVSLKQGDEMVFSAGLEETDTKNLKKLFKNELKKRIPRNSFKNCLTNSAQQFFVKKEKQTKVIAGYHWYNTGGRDTFISLPGLSLGQKDVATCESVLNTMSMELNGSLFMDRQNKKKSLPEVDASLWYIWAIQQYTYHTKQHTEVWKKYGKNIRQILNGYKNGTEYNITMHENGLIYAGQDNLALTWMNAYAFGNAVTPRPGYAVEVNALWYNAVCFALELAEYSKAKKFLKDWKEKPKLIAKSFNNTFWDEKKLYLADFVNPDCKDNPSGYRNWTVRPNQIIAAAMSYSPINEEKIKAVLDKVGQELLTPVGLRTLSPKNHNYVTYCEGNHNERNLAAHQGAAYPWLLSFYCEAVLRIHHKSGISLIQKIYDGFKEKMQDYGIATISEMFDGNPPHQARGAISYAGSVAALLRIRQLKKLFTQ